MLREEIEQRVLAVFRKSKRLASTPLSSDTTFESLNLDSLDVVSIMFDLEDEFQVSIHDDAVRRLGTIGDAVDCISAIVLQGKSS